MRSKRWDPASKDLDGLLFDGAPALLGQLDDLVLRPRRWWRETLLPIIYLVCEPTAQNPLDGLADRLRESCGVLHSRVQECQTASTGDGLPPENSIHRILDGVVADLSQRGSRGRSLRFPHYSLAVLLVGLIMNRPAPHQPDQAGRRVDNALQEFIRERYRLKNKTTSDESILINGIPWWVRIPILLLPPLGTRLMRIFWRPPQWIARTRIASDHSSGSFRGLARRFMEQGSGERQHEIRQDEIDRLLVDAFMEDLRRAYRRTTLFYFGRRRTTYPVLLIDKVGSTTVTLRLLELISDSRTGYLRKNTPGPGRQPRERAYFHPLLIIAQGDSSALGIIGHSNYRPERGDVYSIADIRYYYNQWYRALTESDRTWFIPLGVPTEPPPQGLRTKLTEIRLPAARKPVMMFLAAALLIAGSSITIYSTYYEHCGAWYWEPQLRREALTQDRTQCVGLGPRDHRFFDDVGDVDGMDRELAADLKEVEDRIRQANEEAVKNASYITVVYLSQITSRNLTDYRSELEQLRGVAIAQKRSLSGRPVRVLLANTGGQMEYGEMAAEAIAKEATEDNTLVAVIGMGISRTGARDAILRLANSKIPMVATVISDTSLATNTSQYYHQVGPTNKREAEVGAFYAKNRLGAEKVTIYYPADKDDFYSTDLKDQALRAFEERGFREVLEKSFLPESSDDVTRAGQEACDVGSEGVVFYAGRTSQLQNFLDGMLDKCSGDYPHFLGGDSVSRFVLDGGARKYPTLAVDYLTQASSLAWGSSCSGNINTISFFVEYRDLFGNEVCGSARHGGSFMGYDALQVVIQGVLNVRVDSVDRPSPDAVLRGIEHISGRGALRGASGQINYPRTGDQAVPQDKAMLVLRGRGGVSEEPRRMLLCGQLEKAMPPPDNC